MKENKKQEKQLILSELVDLFESAYKLERKLSSSVITLKIEKETHVPDLMTRIRVLPGVAVVAQKDKVARFLDGDAQLMISVKFLSQSSQILKSISFLSKQIKKLPGVKTVIVHQYNKKNVSLKGKKIVF
tara:strand:- start:734 stop:1123 length:390 start_codon:yes stop_codon:yes gene_type:complete